MPVRPGPHPSASPAAIPVALPQGGAVCPGHRREMDPAFVLPPSGSWPLVRVFAGLLDPGFYPCRCRSLGKKA